MKIKEGVMADQQKKKMTDLLAFIMDMRGGAVAQDLNEKFNEVVGAVLDTGGKGQLTIELNVEPSKMGLGGAVIEVSSEHKCKVKKPELAIGKATFFVTKEGVLTRNDPNQTSMFDATAPAERRQ